MIGWNVARLLGCRLQAQYGVTNQNGVDVQAISNLAIGFPLVFVTRSLVRVMVMVRFRGIG